MRCSAALGDTMMLCCRQIRPGTGPLQGGDLSGPKIRRCFVQYGKCLQSSEAAKCEFMFAYLFQQSLIWYHTRAGGN